MGWVHTNTITGPPAKGAQFLNREYINDEFWREVKKGCHILFVAPRRVGKTSVMKYLCQKPLAGYACIYQDIEGVKSKNEFYQRLFELLLQCISISTKDKVKDWFTGIKNQFNITEVSLTSIKIGRQEINYEEELRALIPRLKESGIHTVIFLDEFAEVINTLFNLGKSEDAIAILHTLRQMRNDDNFSHFTIVYAGSIGLRFVIKTIDRQKLINDLQDVQIGKLEDKEALALISMLTKGATITLSADVLEYLLKKISYLLPYYVQLVIAEIDVVAFKKQMPAITNEIVDEAFDRVLANNRNFEDWQERLVKYQTEDFPFINEILKHCAHKDSITIQEVFNIANDERFNKTNDYMIFVSQLINDGYLIEEPKGVYQFISPFLKQFWLNQYPVYNG